MYCKRLEVIRGWHNLRPEHRECVATVGNFDGVHLGHRAVIEQLAALGRGAGLETALVTFEPQPMEYFVPDSSPARLTRMREKIAVLCALPIDRVVVLSFNEALALMDPAMFIDRLLVSGLGVRHVVVGDDFRFGHKGAGDAEMLEAQGQRHGFAVSRQASFEVDGRRVSSSGVREALARGDLGAAAGMLGRSYTLCGRVASGRRLGRTIGFATANLGLRRNVSPLRGVFAARVHGEGLAGAPAMANVGSRPTVDGSGVVLEVHLFDFDEDIYGAEIQVEFVHRLRDERRFESVDALKAQLHHDAAEARACLDAVPGG